MPRLTTFTFVKYKDRIPRSVTWVENFVVLSDFPNLAGRSSSKSKNIIQQKFKNFVKLIKPTYNINLALKHDITSKCGRFKLDKADGEMRQGLRALLLYSCLSAVAEYRKL
jgi:hypothetical protein